MNYRYTFLNSLIASLLCVASAPFYAHAQCPDDQTMADVAARWIDKQTLRGFSPAMTLADGACARDRLVAQLRAYKRYGGRIVGYKAALTNSPDALHAGVK